MKENVWFVSRIYIYLAILLLNVAGAYSQGESAIISLVFPSGARSLGMGEVGTALANDEDAVFYNAAGLAMRNNRWDGGAATGFYEQLLPAFKIPDLYHAHLAGYYQFSGDHNSGVALDYNYVNFGTNDLSNETGMHVGRYGSYEYVLSAAWGFVLDDLGKGNHTMGLTAKYMRSVLGGSVANDIAFDVSYLWQFLPGARFGLTLQNMGPSVFYVSEEMRDPIPFTLNAALAYSGYIPCNGCESFCKVSAELRANREIVTTYADGRSPEPFWRAIYTDLLHDTSSVNLGWKKVNWHAGIEATFHKTLSLRTGVLIDQAGQRYETHMGFGLQVYNHFQLDWYMIYAPTKFIARWFGGDEKIGARDGQFGVSLTFFRIFSWNENDADLIIQP